jgi:hypothetical protein
VKADFENVLPRPAKGIFKQDNIGKWDGSLESEEAQKQSHHGLDNGSPPERYDGISARQHSSMDAVKGK